MAERESVYIRIKNAMTADGVMPEDFALRERLQDGRQFADGAIDGTIRYHMGPADNTDIEMLTLALKNASNGLYDDAANALITYFAQGIVMLPVMDKVQEWIYAHPGELSPEKLGQFAIILMTQSPDVESVKFGLTILEMLEQEPSEDVKEILWTLASCEELTLFCMFAMSNYDDANEIYFQLAKKLKGWGRIHAVSMLRAENEDIRDWLLTEGWRNEIMPDYSALTVIKRTKLVKLLKEEPDENLRQIAGELIRYALGEEPAISLAGYKRAGELLEAYLSLLDKDCVDAELLAAIKAFLEKNDLENKWQLIDLCNKL